MQHANKTRGVGPLGGSGLIAQWGASSLIRSVQYGLVRVNASTASGTATITAVNTANAVLMYLGMSQDYVTDNANIDAHVVLTNSTTVTATRNGAGPGNYLDVQFVVLEFAPGIVRSVQTGTIAMGGGQTSLTATITAINTATAMVAYGHNMASTGDANASYSRVTLTNSTTVTAARVTGTAGNTVAYSVVEFF